jgi:hypothetical protein
MCGKFSHAQGRCIHTYLKELMYRLQRASRNGVGFGSYGIYVAIEKRVINLGTSDLAIAIQRASELMKVDASFIAAPKPFKPRSITPKETPVEKEHLPPRELNQQSLRMLSIRAERIESDIDALQWKLREIYWQRAGYSVNEEWMFCAACGVHLVQKPRTLCYRCNTWSHQ